VLSGCGYLYLHNFATYVLGSEFKLGFYPTHMVHNPSSHIVHVHSLNYLYEWYQDEQVLNTVYDPYITTVVEQNGEIVLSFEDVNSYSSGSYRVRCIKVDQYTNSVRINVIGNTFLFGFCLEVFQMVI